MTTWKIKINGEYEMLNMLGDDELKETKEEKEFKKKHKKYLAARRKTDQYVKVTRPGNKEPVLNGKPR